MIKRFILVFFTVFLFSLTCLFAQDIVQAPIITSFSPIAAKEAETVTITGINFSDQISANQVFFGSIRATVISASKAQLTVLVPKTAELNKITVLNTKTGLQASSSNAFIPAFNSNNKFNSSDFFDPTIAIDKGVVTPSTVAGIDAGDLDGDGKPELVSCYSDLNVIFIYNNKTSSPNGFAYNARVALATGSGPQMVRIADVNMDGKLDLVTVNKVAGTISVLINQSTSGANITASSFAPKVDFSTAATPISLAVFDADGDGKPDIVTGSAGGFLTILKNQYTGTVFDSNAFVPKRDFYQNLSPDYILAEDLNNDGKPDLILGGKSSEMFILQNKSIPDNVVFSTQRIVLNGSNDATVATVGDLNQDGKPEIILADATNNYNQNRMWVFENSSVGDISFKSRTDIVGNTSSEYITSVKIADIDGDSRPDIVFAYGGKYIGVKRNLFNPDENKIRMAEHVNLSVSGTPKLLVIGKFSFDPYPDIFIQHIENNNLSLLINRVAQPPLVQSVSPIAAEMGSTITISGKNFGDAASNIVFFGGVKAQITAASETQIKAVVPAGASHQPISVLNINTSLIGYSSKPFIPIFPTKKSIAKKDFSILSSFGNSRESKSMAIADLDNNGIMDYVLSNRGNHTVGIYMNGAVNEATYTKATDYEPEGVTIADLDADGYLDIVVGNNYGKSLSVYRNNLSAGGSFMDQVEFGSAPGPRVLAIGDLDGDGKPEIIVAENSLSPQNPYGDGGKFINVLWNKSLKGTIDRYSFATAQYFEVGSSPAFVRIADIDGDGKQDLVVGNGSGSISILRNTIKNYTIDVNSFAPKVLFDVAGVDCVVVDDFDGDGKPDIAASNNEGIALFYNKSTVGTINASSLAGRVTIPVANGASYMESGDIDGDGKPDLIVSNWVENTISILRNSSERGVINIGSFMPPVAINISSHAIGISVADLDKDGITDIAVLTSAQTGCIVKIINKRVIGNLPVVSSFSPNNVRLGTEVTITGKNFTGVTDVRFGGIVCSSFTVTSATTIVAKIAAGGSGTVTVTGTEGAGTLDGFVYIYDQPGEVPPEIKSFSPASGIVGATVIINGDNFGSTAADNQVYFGSVKAEIISASSTSITVKVPAGSVYRPISVVKNKLVAYSAKPFINTFEGSKADFRFMPSSFAQKTDFPALEKATDSFVADIDGDGRIDLVTLNNAAISVFMNTTTNGTVSFTRSDFSILTGANHFLDVDLDGDGKQDVVIANGNNSISVFRNNSTKGNISFLNRFDIATPHVPLSLASGDFDHDGKTDLALSNKDDKSITILKNIGTDAALSFNVEQALPLPNIARGLAVGDLDGDGKVDIAIGNNAGSPSYYVFLNTTNSGGVTFKVPANLSNYTGMTVVPDVVSIVDINGDEKMDLVITQGRYFRLLLNKSTEGNIKFENDGSYSLYNPAISHAVGDLDGDGKIDYTASIDESDMFSIHRNLSTADKFMIAGNVDYKTNGGPRGIITADFDDDGRTDIAHLNYKVNSISIYKNAKVDPVGIASFTPKAASANTEVLIQGLGFTGATSVSFGGVEAEKFTVVSPQSIRANVGLGATGEVKVVTPLGAASLTGFTYNEIAPVMYSFSPMFGGEGEVITINGSGFTNVTAVTIAGQNVASYTVVSSTVINFVVGKGASGPVVVTTAKGQATWYPSFTIIGPPTITSFTPSIAKPGATVVIRGSNFYLVKEVSIGNVPASSFRVNNSDYIEAVVGSDASSGAVFIKATGGTVSLEGFTIIPLPTISSFSPNFGYAGSVVTITGKNLDGVTRVTFGGQPVSSFKIVSPKIITAVLSSNMSSGDVMVQSQNGNSSLGTFTYAPPPTITSLSQNAAITGTPITITGKNFGLYGLSVTFGGVPAASVIRYSDTKIIATVSAGQSGDVSLTTEGGTAIYPGFVHLAKPIINALGATTFVTGGRVELRVTPMAEYSYQWTKNGVAISGAVNTSYEAKETGLYAVVATYKSVNASSGSIAVNVIFSLPSNNFSLKVTGESCRTSNDGAISITSTKELNYTVTLSGSINSTYTFNNKLDIGNLVAGTYSLCITLANEPTFNQCYDLVITEPKDLAVYSTVGNDGRLLLQLSGGKNYSIMLNGKSYQTGSSQIDLPLKAGENNLQVSTDKLCQGVYNKTIFQAGDNNVVYPNPFVDQLTLKLPNLEIKTVDIEILDMIGIAVLKGKYVSNNGFISMAVDKLVPGIYLLKFVADNGEKSIYKVIKK
ncbi:FG-GAP-like repeat-containing protein [Pedobacter sp. GSP4]|uniref:FG-GAP-like repeat-containing protein n=1 Tax=Pedobacter sp. GSP4 TaxID=3453716 RepID=UPI003EF0054A